jgi:hypothetical protein
MSLPDEVLYKIFKIFIADKTLSNISLINKECYNIVNKKLIFMHYNKIISNMQQENNILEIENYLVKKENTSLNNLYDDLLITIDDYMNIN